MLKKAILILPLFLQFCIQYNKSDISPISLDEYEVYSCVLDSAIRRDSIKVFIDKNTISFYKRGAPLGFHNEVQAKIQENDRIRDYIDYLYSSIEYKERMKKISKSWNQFDKDDIIEDLLIKNIYSFKLDENSLNTPFTLNTVDKYDSLAHRETTSGIAVRIAFSRAGFNSDVTQSMVYVVYYCGILCASFDYYLLHKNESGWKIVEKINRGVS